MMDYLDKKVTYKEQNDIQNTLNSSGFLIYVLHSSHLTVYLKYTDNCTTDSFRFPFDNDLRSAEASTQTSKAGLQIEFRL